MTLDIQLYAAGMEIGSDALPVAHWAARTILEINVYYQFFWKTKPGVPIPMKPPRHSDLMSPGIPT
jgi:hypothetical protein